MFRNANQNFIAPNSIKVQNTSNNFRCSRNSTQWSIKKPKQVSTPPKSHVSNGVRMQSKKKRTSSEFNVFSTSRMQINPFRDIVDFALTGNPGRLSGIVLRYFLPSVLRHDGCGSFYYRGLSATTKWRRGKKKRGCSIFVAMRIREGGFDLHEGWRAKCWSVNICWSEKDGQTLFPILTEPGMVNCCKRARLHSVRRKSVFRYRVNICMFPGTGGQATNVRFSAVVCCVASQRKAGILFFGSSQIE